MNKSLLLTMAALTGGGRERPNDGTGWNQIEGSAGPDHLFRHRR